ITLAVLVVIGILLLILALTVFKPKSPVISIDSVQLQSFNVSLNLLSPRLELGLTMWVSVYNPNRASFKYTNSTSVITYHGDEVGNARIPAGEIGARGREKFPTDVSIQAMQIVGNSNLLPDVASGSIPISTRTVVSGRVNVLNVIKRHATSTSVCNVTISVASRNVQDFKCSHKTKL
ncbi:hypothetical protein SELMODRAFT_17213, partial [Selaginella moellendorffii]